MGTPSPRLTESRPMTSSQRRLIEGWIAIALAAGWSASQRGGHWKLCYPDGRFALSLPCTPGGGTRGVRNARARLRRAGLEIE